MLFCQLLREDFKDVRLLFCCLWRVGKGTDKVGRGSVSSVLRKESAGGCAGHEVVFISTRQDRYSVLQRKDKKT